MGTTDVDFADAVIADFYRTGSLPSEVLGMGEDHLKELIDAIPDIHTELLRQLRQLIVH